uniref:Uncharacterized protein n=1 Tax=Rhizophora mucronata TaxID=61149 RepID=A0A2P2QAQ4_RHIMU
MRKRRKFTREEHHGFRAVKFLGLKFDFPLSPRFFSFSFWSS